MILDVDFLIDFFNKYSGKGYKKEMGEQAAAAPPARHSAVCAAAGAPCRRCPGDHAGDVRGPLETVCHLRSQPVVRAVGAGLRPDRGAAVQTEAGPTAGALGTGGGTVGDD